MCTHLPHTSHLFTLLNRHLAAAEGCHSVAVWLLSQAANVNAIDRFNRTPLEVRHNVGRRQARRRQTRHRGAGSAEGLWGGRHLTLGEAQVR